MTQALRLVAIAAEQAADAAARAYDVCVFGATTSQVPADRLSMMAGTLAEAAALAFDQAYEANARLGKSLSFLRDEAEFFRAMAYWDAKA